MKKDEKQLDEAIQKNTIFQSDDGMQIIEVKAIDANTETIDDASVAPLSSSEPEQIIVPQGVEVIIEAEDNAENNSNITNDTTTSKEDTKAKKKEKKERKERNAKKLGKIVRIIIAILIVEILGITFYLGTNKEIFHGVYVEDISLGGLTRKEAQSLLEEKLTSEVINKNIIFYYDDYTKEVPLNTIIESLDYAKLAREAQQVGRKGNLIERFMQCMNLLSHRLELNLKFTVNMSNLRDAVYSMKYELDRESVDATATKEHGKEFQITSEVIGIDMNVAKTIDYYREVIENNEFEDYEYHLKAIASEKIPLTTKEYYESYSTLLSSYMTEYRRSDAVRTKSLEEATEKLDKYVLQPDKEFSFNEVLVNAKESDSNTNTDVNDEDDNTNTSKEEVDLTNRSVDVNVQLASTLYNAVLLANLEVTDRTNCASALSYIDIGRDALVYGKHVDFKFKNNTTNPIYIEAYVNNGKLYVKIYGSENFKEFDSITFRHKITKVSPPLEEIVTIDDDLEAGERVVTYEGESGYQVELYATYKKAGAKDKEEKINESIYLPTATRVSIGVGDENPLDETGEDLEDINENDVDDSFERAERIRERLSDLLEDVDDAIIIG